MEYEFVRNLSCGDLGVGLVNCFLIATYHLHQTTTVVAVTVVRDGDTSANTFRRVSLVRYRCHHLPLSFRHENAASRNSYYLSLQSSQLSQFDTQLPAPFPVPFDSAVAALA